MNVSHPTMQEVLGSNPNFGIDVCSEWDSILKRRPGLFSPRVHMLIVSQPNKPNEFI